MHPPNIQFEVLCINIGSIVIITVEVMMLNTYKYSLQEGEHKYIDFNPTHPPPSPQVCV